MNSSKQIKWGALLSYFSIAVNIVSGLLYTPWMVKTIGSSEYGLYTLANTLITMFMVDFGLSAATGRYLSKYIAEGRQLEAERFLGAVYKLYMIIDGIIFTVLFVMFFFLDKIYVKLTPEELEQFRVVYVISAIYSLINFPLVTYNGILTAYEKFISLKFADLLYRFLYVGITVIALLLGQRLYALVAIHAGAGLLALLFKYVVIRRSVPIRTSFKNTPKGIYKEIFSFSLWVTISSLSLRLIINITPSILGVMADSAAIAVFGIVTTIEGYAYTITNAINGMFMPKVSQIMTQENAKEKLNGLFLSVGKFQHALNGLIVAGFAVVGQSFVDLWMGPDYKQAFWGGLMIIVPSMFYNSLQIAHTTVVVQNKVKLTSFINLSIGILNVVLSFPLSKYFGVLGACGAIAITYIVRAVLCNIVYQKVLPLNIPGFIKTCYLKMTLPIILTVLCGMGINYWIADGGWMIFLMKACITATIYIVLVFVLGLQKNERKRILAIFKRGKNNL